MYFVGAVAGALKKISVLKKLIKYKMAIGGVYK